MQKQTKDDGMRESKSRLASVLKELIYVLPYFGDSHYFKEISTSSLPRRDKIASIAVFLSVKYTAFAAIASGLYYLCHSR